MPEHDHADRLTRLACDKQSLDIDFGIPLPRISQITRTSSQKLSDLTHSQRSESCSTKDLKHMHIVLHVWITWDKRDCK